MTGQMAGRGILLLTSKGARSGQPRTAVLGYGRHGDRYVVIASNNGASRAPAWYHNLLSHPEATVEVGPDTFEVRATTAKPEERDELAKTVPYLESQHKLTGRPEVGDQLLVESGSCRRGSRVAWLRSRVEHWSVG